jgi:hypothetical protein
MLRKPQAVASPADCRSLEPRRFKSPGSRRKRAWAQNGVARKMEPNGLKTLNQRPEFVASRKPRSHKMWYTGARGSPCAPTDRGWGGLGVPVLQKMAPNVLKSRHAATESPRLEGSPRPDRRFGPVDTPSLSRGLMRFFSGKRI